MKTIDTTRGATARRSRSGLPVLLTGLAFGLAACDDILRVTDPTVADPESVQTETAVPTSLNSAIADFALAITGAPGGGSVYDSQIMIAGLLGDEWAASGSFPTRIEVNRRETTLDNTTMQGAFSRLHRARRLAETSADLHAQFEGTANTAGHAHALNIAGFSYLLFGENYCSGVPFSAVLPDGSLEFGPPLSTQEMLQTAISFFEQARSIAEAADSESQLNLARVGIARSLLNLGDRAQAAQVASAVPTDFAYRVFHSEGTTRQQNGIWAANTSQRRYSVADRIGGNGLPYRSDSDPRVQWEAGTGGRAVGFDAATPYFDQLKYPARATSVILASGIEARLIEAEAALAAGGNWLGMLNALRASPPAYYPATEFPGIGTLDALSDPGSPAARVDLLFRERAYWMWLTSHRLGDMRRLVRDYDRPVNQVFPTGSYFKGGTYGDHVSMLVPFDELNNPLAVECDPSGA
jgi:starch-binding outer membrane protein, SusD/RagB family